jgi:hypothetical protein
MSATDFVTKSLATGGIAIHRSTCKRVEGHELVGLQQYLDASGSWDDQVTAEELRLLSEAKLASCCKPKGAALYVSEAKQTYGLMEFHGVDSLAALLPLLGVEVPADEPELVEPELVALVEPEPVDLTGISKHYWDALLRVAIPLDPSAVDRGECLAAFAALKVWRRADVDYRALPSQDTGWVKSERYAWERDFLVGYVSERRGLKPKAHFGALAAARRGALAAKASDLI